MRYIEITDYTEDSQPINITAYYRLTPPEPDTDDTPGIGANYSVDRVLLDGNPIGWAEFIKHHPDAFMEIHDKVGQIMIDEFNL